MKDKVIAVTGAAGVLGSVVLGRLTDAGAEVIALDLARIPAAAGSALALAGVDLSDRQAVDQAFRTIAESYEKLDGLVNIAGGFQWETIANGTIETWDKLYAMNLRSNVLATQAGLPLLMAGTGAIVNVSAAATRHADVGMGPYAAAKSGVSRLTESLAAELKDHGVRVNAVLPSIIDTPRNRADMPQADFARWVTPAALADVILFLLSDAARAVTGALLPVTGRL